MLNWIGGAYIFVRLRFTDRLKIIGSSWAKANNKKEDAVHVDDENAEGAEEGEEGKDKAEDQNDQDENEGGNAAMDEQQKKTHSKKKVNKWTMFGAKKS